MSDASSTESSSLLGGQRQHRDDQDDRRHIQRGLLWRLYISHFLSTWNMRCYEFTVILLFAAAYPTSLLPTSIRGVLVNGATVVLSPSIGAWVDRNASRFHTIKITIVVQRTCVVLGCLLWIFLFSTTADDGRRLPRLQTRAEAGSHSNESVESFSAPKNWIIAVLILFGTIERICAVGNNLVMERDWVPTIASEVSQPPLHQLNAIMRRIDLVSKIIAPIFVSVIDIRTSAVMLAAVTAVMNLATVGVELVAARTAWNMCNVLHLAREPKPNPAGGEQQEMQRSDSEHRDEPPVSPRRRGLALYFSNDACLASLSAALQSFSVLSLSGPMTTYLLTRHFSLSLITTARTAISIVEIGSTLVFPLAASVLTRHPPRLLPDAITTLGLLGVTTQLLLLVPCCMALVLVPTDAADPATAFPLLTLFIFVFLGLSRLGHWTHNMAVQQIVQTRVAVQHRVEFSGVEMTFVSAAEIGRWASAAVWHSPEQFKGVAVAGLASVVVIWGLFAVWVARSRRRAAAHRE